MSEPAVAAVAPAPPLPLDRFARFLKDHERCGLVAGVIFQLAVLGTMVALRAWVLWSGQVYLVRVVPVDPRDLLRGDYVILGYEFSRVPAGVVSHSQDLAGRPIYVTLRRAEDGKLWVPEQYLLAPPADGRPFLQGRLTGWGRAEYGIESYFVQEGRGHAYEEAARSGRLAAEIAITPDGTPALRALHIVSR